MKISYSAAWIAVTTFLRHPGHSGPFGALMDEYARAAHDFCRAAEGFDITRFSAGAPVKQHVADEQRQAGAKAK